MKTIAKRRTSAVRALMQEPGDLYWIGTNVANLRAKRGWSQAELAARADVSERTLRMLESAAPGVNPTLRTLAEIAKQFQVATVDLYRRRQNDWALKA